MVLKTLRKVLRNYYKYMFKDTKEGSTHHDKDACYKCEKCGGHYFTESYREQHECWIGVYSDFKEARDNIDLTNK